MKLFLLILFVSLSAVAQAEQMIIRVSIEGKPKPSARVDTMLRLVEEQRAARAAFAHGLEVRASVIPELSGVVVLANERARFGSGVEVHIGVPLYGRHDGTARAQ